MNGSYELHSFTQNRATEVTRLKSQVELFLNGELEIYKRVGFQDGLKVLECGCGPGYLLFNLAKEFPKCAYTGLEIDSYLYEVFKENISEYKTQNIRAKQGSIYKTGEPDDFFDVVISRLVLEHLEKPSDAIREMFRVLKPGGILIIVSNDFEYHVLTFPHIPELDLMYKAYCSLRIDEGGNPYIGRELPTYLKHIGAENINLNIAAVHSNILGDKALLKAENVNISRSLVKEGYLKQETLDTLSDKWYEMLQNPKHIIYRQLFVISGMKKANHNTEVHVETLVTAEPKSEKKINISSGAVKTTDYLISIIKESFDDDTLAIDPHTKLNEYGIDSLIATEIAGLLKSTFGLTVKLSDILNKYSVSDMVKTIESNKSIPEDLNQSDDANWSEGEL